ncbi:MAG: hypothetical protein ACPLRN_00225 [Microgenomates group bacterium]
MKKYLPFIGGLVFVVLFFIFFINQKNNSKNKKNIVNVSPTEQLIPTVDTSVKADFQLIKKGEAALKIINIPKNTLSIDFELSYLVKNNDVSEGDDGELEQGVIGKCYQFQEDWQCGEAKDGGSRKIVLGTCSSGVCRYHNIVSPIKVVLKFTGDYGQKIFQKEYKL